MIVSSFIYEIKAYFSSEILRNYMLSNYEFFTITNSSELVSNVTLETNEFSKRVLEPMAVLVSEVTVIIAITILVFTLEPLLATLLFTAILLAMLTFQLSTRSMLSLWGSQRQIYERQRVKAAQQSLAGIQQIKLQSKEQQFSKVFEAVNLNLSEVEKKQFAISCAASVARNHWNLGNPHNHALFHSCRRDFFKGHRDTRIVWGSSRSTLPSANRILASVQLIKYADAVCSLMFASVGTQSQDTYTNGGIKVTTNKEKTSKYCIQFDNVSFKYRDAPKFAVKNCSFEFEFGKIYGIKGESGSGKSTLVSLILGLLEAQKGNISVNGIDINETLNQWQNSIGYVEQHIYLIDDTISRNIAFCQENEEIDESLVWNSIKVACLEEIIKESKDGLNRMVGERGVQLSGGQLQRIGIARALYRSPKLLIFDEATSALDRKTERRLIDNVFKHNPKQTIITVAQ